MNDKSIKSVNMGIKFMRKAIVPILTMLCVSIAVKGMSAESAVSFVGYMCYSGAWHDKTYPIPEYGFYTFSEDGENGFRAVSEVGTNSVATNSGTYMNGKYYCVQTSGNYAIYRVYFHVVDPETWAVNTFTMAENYAEGVASDLAYDPIGDVLYAVTYEKMSNSNSGYLCTVDPATGLFSRIKQIQFMCVLACDASGNLWGIGKDGGFYSIAKNGDCELIGSTGYVPTDAMQSATFDFRTGKLYWAANAFTADDRTHSNLYSGLMEIDTESGNASMLWSFPRQEEITCLSIENAHPDAPDNIIDLEFAPVADGAMTGKVAFTVPQKTYAQASLTGTVNVAITLDGSKFFMETAQAGSRFEKEIAVDGEGNHTVKVTLSANGHSGVKASAASFFGIDIPEAPAEVKLSYGKDRQSVSLSWSAPEQGANGGFIAPQELSYDVVRYPEGVVVAEGLTATTWRDDIEREMERTRYAVKAVNKNGKESAPAYSAYDILGKPFSLPYEESFDSENAFNRFTVIDANGDGGEFGWEDPVWKFDNEYYAAFYYLSSNAADDWLISPALGMQDDKFYKLTFKAYGYYGYPERLQITVGDEPVAAAQKVVVEKNFSAAQDSPVMLSVYLPVRNGATYIGFHNVSQPGEKGHTDHLSIDNISVEAIASSGVPDAVTDLQLEADRSTGAPTVKFTFKAPSVTVKGDALSGKVDIRIYRGNVTAEPAVVLSGRNPGEQIEWLDKSVVATAYTYRIVTSNAEGDGMEVDCSIDLTESVPPAVSNLKATYINNRMEISWDAPEAEGESSFDEETLRYMVYRTTSIQTTLVGRDVESTRFVDASPAADLTDRQGYVSYSVCPVTMAGEGAPVSTNRILVGSPYELPFKETWERQMASSSPWVNLSDDYGAAWTVVGTGYDPFTLGQDGQGLLSMSIDDYYLIPGTADYVSPCFDLSEYDAPVLSFYMYGANTYDAATTSLRIGVMVDDAEPVFGTETYSPYNSEKGWKEITVPLDAYKGKPNVSIVFRGHIEKANNSIHIDNVRITGTAYGNDLKAASMVVPPVMQVGKDCEVTATVKNVGTNDSGNFKVELYAQGELSDTKQVEALAHGEETTVSFIYRPTDIQAGDEITFNAKILMDADEFSGNNEVVAVSEVEPLNPPYVSDLSGQVSGNAVELSWSLMTPRSGQVNESAEAYEAFSIDNFGLWTLEDRDQMLPFTFSDATGAPIVWENNDRLQAFMVFNPEAIDIAKAFDAHTGKQCFISWAAAGAANDDWLISPVLPEKKQLVSFYARGVDSYQADEAFVVWACGSDGEYMNVSGNNPVIATPEWKLYHFALPEGTRHFAINYIAKNIVSKKGLMVDDILFEGYPVNELPLGYNVFRDGKKINQEPVAGRSFRDEPGADGDYIYTVTAVFEDGETEASDEVRISFSGVEGLKASRTSVNAVRNEIVVKNAEGKQIEVFTTDGLLVRKMDGAESVRIPMPSGLYIAKVGDVVCKVAVR